MATSRFIDVRVTGLREFAAAMGRVGEQAFDRSQRSAVTFIAKDYKAFKLGKISSDIDRPTRFTRQAYDWDGASRTGDIVSRAFVRPKQSEYLDVVEEGGIRRRRGKNGPVAPKSDVTDTYGGLFGHKGLEKRFLSKSRARAAAAAARGRRGSQWRTGQVRYAVFGMGSGANRVFGLWEMKRQKRADQRANAGRAGSRFGGRYESRWRTRLIVKFERQATYRPTLNFQADARRYARDRFPRLSLRLFNRELQRALGH